MPKVTTCALTTLLGEGPTTFLGVFQKHQQPIEIPIAKYAIVCYNNNTINNNNHHHHSTNHTGRSTSD
eukprot:m.196751 g.196751  ORF g.196751 m.196751 type:complete len:68 (-) comp32632_c0_seq2:116-319(-)